MTDASLSTRTVSVAHETLSGQRTGLRGALAFVGPAVVASVAYVDPGNIATNMQAGARYGYQLLWVVLFANAVAMLFQAMSAKIGIATGQNLAELCRDHFPGRSCSRCGSPAKSPPSPPILPSSLGPRWAFRCCSAFP